VSKRVRLDKNASSKSKSVTSAPAPRWMLFGQPPLLDGEDAAAYDELLARIHAAVKPGDIIEAMLISDVASLARPDEADTFVVVSACGGEEIERPESTLGFRRITTSNKTCSLFNPVFD
jgi:hypothetical protein